jgi:hypothetical protein
MILYPKYYCRKITEIDISFLEKNNIKALILDVDNTLIDTDRVLLEGLEKWHKDICNAGIKTIILSNSNKVDKVSSVAKTLGIEYIYFGTKPLKRGFKKAIEKLNLPPENIAAVGDQIFTDVIGANRCKLFPILVEPINEKDLLITKWKRPIEEKIIKKYLKNK